MGSVKEAEPYGTRLNTITDLLQNRDAYIRDIVDGVGLRNKAKQLTKLSSAAFLLYGLIIGSHQNLLQALSSAIKLPILFLLTIAVCMPALHIFSSFFGSRRSALQTFVWLLTATTTMAISLVGWAPVSLFFAVTTTNYQFFKLLNVLFFFISGVLGVLVLSRLYSAFPEREQENKRTRMILLRAWFVLYAFVGTQLAWTLRPFFGAPSLPFEFVRQFGGNFYTDILRALAHIFGST